MNLRVDLILPSEQRSGSVLSPKSLTRIASVALPTIMAVVIAIFGYQYLKLRGQVKNLEEAWESAKPKEARSEEVRQQLARNKKILEEIEGWKKSNIDWHWALLSLQKQVPDNIALTSLALDHSLKTTQDKPVRAYSILFSARAEGKDAEYTIRRFEGALEQAAQLKDMLETVEVVQGSYREDTATENEFDRVFRMSCKFKPRAFQ